VFLKNQRRWESSPLKEEDITQFREACDENNYDPRRSWPGVIELTIRDILPHGSYLVNLANPDKEKRMKAYEGFLDELKRCEQLGIGRHNFQ
jgi:AP endonuclease 1